MPNWETRRYRDASTMTLLLLVGSREERKEWYGAPTENLFTPAIDGEILHNAASILEDRIDEGRKP